MREITLGSDAAGQRLDRYLRKLLRTVPLAAIFRHLRTGAIRVDGGKAEPSLRLQAGMRVALRLPAADVAAAGTARASGPRRGAFPAALRPRIVHQDADVLVVAKPAGLAVQPGTGAGDENLVAWLDGCDLGVRTATFAPAPAHRLDRGTSGLVAIGLSPAGLRGLTAAFREDRVRKVYVAVVHGVPEPARGTIDAPLRAVGGARADGPKVAVDPRGSAARTDYEVIERGRDRALLRLLLHTGRTHQIRAHLAHLGHPIVGDVRYGAPARTAPRMLLHAAELELRHPCTGEPLRCVDEAPRGFAQALRR